MRSRGVVRFAFTVLATNLLSFSVTLIAVVSLQQRYFRGSEYSGDNSKQHPHVARAVTECCSCAVPEGVSRFYCPTFEGSIDISPSGEVQLGNSNRYLLCTLSQIGSDSSLKPVARSYNGRDWEKSAGEYVYMDITCLNGLCNVSLPIIPDGSRFQLTTFRPPAYTGRDEIARFLEQSTFGPTLLDINAFDISNLHLSFATWIKAQQTSVPLTSHREYYRRHIKGRSEVSSAMGAVTHPCQLGTMYRRFAFSPRDQDKVLTIETVGSYVKLTIDGFVRTVVKGPVVAKVGGAVFPDRKYVVCRYGVGSYIGGDIFIRDSNSLCIAANFDESGGNPSIQFDGGDPPINVVNLVWTNDLEEVAPIGGTIDSAQQLVVLNDLSHPICATLSEPGNPIDLVFGQLQGHYWIHDPRHELLDNTVESPLPDGGASIVKATANFGAPYFSTLCSNVAPSFLNHDSCILGSVDETCTVGSGYQSREDVTVRLIPLNHTTMQLVYRESGNGSVGTLYFYAIDGLNITEDPTVVPPCNGNARSRWIKVECSISDANIATQDIFRQLFANARTNDANPNVLDVQMTKTSGCHGDDAFKVGFRVIDQDQDAQQCWRNVHPDHLNVYDFTSWTRSHPGNTPYRNPIKEFAEIGLSALVFPSSHELLRWQSNKAKFRLVGRLGDQIDYYTIPPGTRTSGFNAGVGFNPETATPSWAQNMSVGSLVCGSPNEVATIPTFVGTDPRSAFSTWIGYNNAVSDPDLGKQRKTVWANIALKASDQLRQRVAWALAQILVVSPNSINDGVRLTELFVTYYDIFVRNAFGNYRDVLKQVAFSPVMANMLTYFNSKSTAYEYDQSGDIKYADENFAREVMQLFTVGLYKLHPNGVKVLDKQSQTVLLYSNEDIIEYARAWTGFTSQPLRGNVEAKNVNRIDPMRIQERWRDPFPKMGLDRSYIGDGFPLCSDLPDKHFLAKGATYRLIGRSANPLSQRDPTSWARNTGVVRLQLEPNGPDSLFSRLCGSQFPDQCTFVNHIVLDDNLICSGRECSVDTVRTVEVVEGVFYEYHRLPCVYQAFYDNPKVVTPFDLGKNLYCADPRTEVAVTACCSAKRVWNLTYWGERSTFSTATERCNNKLCSHLVRPSCHGVVDGICEGKDRFWTSAGCILHVKIDDDANVAIVHAPAAAVSVAVAGRVGEHTKTFFRVNWNDTNAVKAIVANCTSISACVKTVDEMCLCPVSVSEAQAYFDGDSPSQDEVLRLLHIGAFDPSSRSSAYTSQTLSEVTWYDTTESLSPDSVFRVTDSAGRTQLRKNLQSTVTIVGSSISFRNPVHFVSLEDPEPRDAIYETDAALDQYFYHSNTAPFLATRLAQRFGVSNPSPGFTERIATSFRTGFYLFVSGESNVAFGSGKYGDLAATVACVLLDPEARSVVLDADPAHGSLKEPLLKFIGLMRSLQFEAAASFPFVDFHDGAGAAIGQMAHEIPTVFSFFLPGYKPSGVVSQASLVAPEAQVLSTPRIINLLNALLSLIKYGLDKCYNGLGANNRRTCKAGNYVGSAGQLTYTPSSTSPVAIVNELATLMTAGRLSPETRRVLQNVYSNETNKVLAVIMTQCLIAVSPEFHINTIFQRSVGGRPNAVRTRSSKNSYKAVVHILLDGGFDSFNMLVPHTCTSTNEGGQTLLEQYNAERTSIAFTDGERARLIDAIGQPCTQFAIHPDLDIVEMLYKEGDLAFFANAGVLTAPVKYSNYTRVTKTTLFDHNSMRLEGQRIDPFNRLPATGILGRMCEKLKEKGYNALPMNVEDTAVATVGAPGSAVTPLTASETATSTFNPKPPTENFNPTSLLIDINGKGSHQSSLFGETGSSSVIQALHESTNVLDDFSKLNLSESWAGGEYVLRMKTAAKLVAASVHRGTDRDAVFVSLPGWDHHYAVKERLSLNFAELNMALTYFKKEMVAQGLWEKVSVVVTSDFGRTLTANSGDGSDHGWGGNYFIMGGSVLGGQIHGQYPQDITEASSLNVGRGRILPTTSWDSIMNGVLDWMGIEDDVSLDYCLPNRLKTGTHLFKKSELFSGITTSAS